jgi:uncharacterized protein (DUF1697 family)
MRYVALLRGINVGGNNVIKMADLRSCLESHGLRDVVTYIQSGNVLFTTTGSERDKLVRRIEGVLGESFDYRASVVLRTSKQMRDVVERAPAGFGADPAKYRYDVIFLKDPLTASTAMKSVLAREGVDEAHAGVGVLYFSRLISKASQSQLAKLASMPVYKSMTIRNWNTSTKLVEMLDA